MPTVEEGIEKLLFWKRQGKGHLHLPHLVLVEEEKQKQIANAPDEQGKRKTRIAWDAADPDTFAEFHKERERYMKAAGSNPTLATDVMIIALRLHTDEEIREFIESVQRVESTNPAVPRVQIPKEELGAL